MNALTNQLEGTSRRSIRSKNPNSADKRLPSIDTPVSTSIDSHYKPKPSLFTKKNMSIDYDFLTPNEFGIFRDKDGHARAMDGRILQVSREDIADILQLANGPDNLFMQQRSIPDEIGSHQSCRPVGQASIDKVAPTSFDRVTLMSLDKAPSQSIDRRYECGRRAYDVYRARKFRWEQKDEYDNIRKILERASLFEESHLCLPEHATSFTLTKLAPEIYTKDEINEMVTGICGAQEKLGDKFKTLIAYINTRINDVYNPLNNNADWLSTRIDLLHQDLDTIRKKDPQSATSIDICTIPSIDNKFAAMEDRLQSFEDMHDRFTSPIMRYLDTLSTQMMDEEGSTSIDRFRRESLDGKKPTEHLPYTAAKVDHITSKLYTAIDTMEDWFEKRCDVIYFPLDVRPSGLDSHA
ncbi:unnamed protein product [Brassica oleracea]